MAFQLIVILAMFACASANYVISGGLNIPYTDYDTSIVLSALPYGAAYAGYNYAPQLAVPNVLPVVGEPVRTAHIGNYVEPQVVSVADGLPAGKTSLTKTFISTPTYVTSHISERVHTDEPVRPFYNSYGYAKDAVNAVPSLAYPVNYAAPLLYRVGKHGW